MSVVGVPMLLGPILGPVIGGLIVDSASWRWIFYVNVPIAVVALVLAARLLQGRRGPRRRRAARLARAARCSRPASAGIVFGLSESESHGGFGDPLVWGPIVVGIVLVALFVRHAWRAERPLIDVRLFRDRVFAAASATTFLLGGALFGAMIILPLYYQVARGESALTAGLLMAPQGLGAAAGDADRRAADRQARRRPGGGGRAADPDRRDDPVRVPRSRTPRTRLLGAAARAARARDRLVDDAVDGRRLRLARARGGAARDERAQRGAAGRRLARHGAARGRAAGADQGSARRRGRRRRRDARAAARTTCGRAWPSRWPTRSPTRSGGRSGCRCSRSCPRSCSR